MDRVSSIFERFDPERSALTSDVIAHVRQRASVSGARVHSTDKRYGPATPPQAPAQRSTSLRIPETTKPQFPLRQLMEVSLSRKFDSVDLQGPANSPQDAAPAAPRPTSFHTPTHPLSAFHAAGKRAAPPTTKPKPKRKRIRIKTERRREQCRTNQARYRKKQTDYAKNLEITVDQLKHEIPLLEKQRSRLMSTAKPSALKVVEEYFRVFSRGIRSSSVAGPQAWLQSSEEQQRIAFLKAAMAPNVAFGELLGVEAFVEQWKRYSCHFNDLFFQLEHLRQSNPEMVEAFATLNVTISETSLQHIFSHLAEPTTGRAAALRSKLLGQRLFLPYSALFMWDEDNCWVTRVESSIDFLKPIRQLVGSLEDAAFVLARALITPDCVIGK